MELHFIYQITQFFNERRGLCDIFTGLVFKQTIDLLTFSLNQFIYVFLNFNKVSFNSIIERQIKVVYHKKFRLNLIISQLLLYKVSFTLNSFKRNFIYILLICLLHFRRSYILSWENNILQFVLPVQLFNLRPNILSRIKLQFSD